MEKIGLQFVRSFRSEWPVQIPGDEHGDVTYAIDHIAWQRARDSAVTVPGAGTPRDIATVLDLIVRQQQRPERNIPSLGFERAGVLAELEEFEPTWTDTLRVVRSADGLVVGAVVTEWDAEVSRAWIHGPWIDVDDEEWQVVAESLVAAARAQIPIDITTSVLSGDVTHQCLADLAGRCGWVVGEVNHTLAVDSEAIVRWPSTPGAVELWSAEPSDSAAIRELHDTEFPAAYYSAGQLVDRAVNGDHVVLIAGRARGGGGRDSRDGRDGGVDGYVAGRIQPDGEGYIDFLAVDPRARRAQIGRNLVMALTRRLMPMSTTQRVCLTVQDRRKPARAMYQSLGFTVDGSIVGYTRDETGT